MNIPFVETKRCCDCGLEKQHIDFYRSLIYGLNRRCVVCIRAYRRRLYGRPAEWRTRPPSFWARPNPLREEIERLFEEGGLGQAGVAKRLGVSRNTVIGIIDRARRLGRIPTAPPYKPIHDPFPANSRGCRYIEGDPLKGAMCCGKKTLHGDWCPKHRAIVYRPLQLQAAH